MDKNISHLVSEACKRAGIDYKSCNPNYVDFTNDAQLLGQIYRDLLEIAEKLTEISERHSIPELKLDISKIQAIDHDLVRVATKIREEEEC